MRYASEDLYTAAFNMAIKYTCPVYPHIVFWMIRTRTCKRCGLESIRQEDYMNLSLDLLHRCSVSDYMQEYQLDNQCKCGGKKSLQQWSFLTLPNVLILQLQRFSFSLDFGLKKVNSAIKISKKLVINPGTVAEQTYSLVCIVAIWAPQPIHLWQCWQTEATGWLNASLSHIWRHARQWDDLCLCVFKAKEICIHPVLWETGVKQISMTCCFYSVSKNKNPRVKMGRIILADGCPYMSLDQLILGWGRTFLFNYIQFKSTKFKNFIYNIRPQGATQDTWSRIVGSRITTCTWVRPPLLLCVHSKRDLHTICSMRNR